MQRCTSVLKNSNFDCNTIQSWTRWPKFFNKLRLYTLKYAYYCERGKLYLTLNKNSRKKDRNPNRDSARWIKKTTIISDRSQDAIYSVLYILFNWWIENNLSIGSNHLNRKKSYSSLYTESYAHERNYSRAVYYRWRFAFHCFFFIVRFFDDFFSLLIKRLSGTFHYRYYDEWFNVWVQKNLKYINGVFRIIVKIIKPLYIASHCIVLAKMALKFIKNTNGGYFTASN